MHLEVMMLTTVAILLLGWSLAGARDGGHYEHPVDVEDADLTVPQLVAKYGYPIEEHDVLTTDGYILGMHRVPHGRAESNDRSRGARPAVLVIHGLISSSADYFIMGPEKGLGYILADEGYDVWMGNARGNSYSKRHTTLLPNSSAFWNFSWEEIGTHDLPAMIDYILSINKQTKLHYIGHSQGTTSFFVLTSMKPEYNDKIKTAHLMAPVGFMHHINSPMLQSMAVHSNTLMTLGTLLGMHEMLARGSAFKYDNGEIQCLDNPLFNLMGDLCDAFTAAFVSQDLDEFNAEMLPVIIGHTPSGSSLKQFAHYGQTMADGHFCRWNFGSTLLNRIMYGVSPPPAYPIGNINCSVYLHYSRGDALTSEKDVNMVASYLSNSKVVRTPKDISHFDFVWGNNARKYVYEEILTVMSNFEKQAV